MEETKEGKQPITMVEDVLTLLVTLEGSSQGDNLIRKSLISHGCGLWLDCLLVSGAVSTE